MLPGPAIDMRRRTVRGADRGGFPDLRGRGPPGPGGAPGRVAVVLLATGPDLIAAVMSQLDSQIAVLPRADIARLSPMRGSSWSGIVETARISNDTRPST